MPETARGPLPGIQVLRALAALLVVVHHTQLNVTQGFNLPAALPRFDVGSAGVDIFFVISGFIMVVSSQGLFGKAGAARIFIERRLIRIVPLYWLVTTLYVLATLVVSPGNSRVLSAPDLVASYLFFPLAAPGGAAMPALVVGWTLNYEMFFYGLFALALLAPRRWAVPGLVAGLVGLVLAHETGQVTGMPLLVWSDPIVIEFAFGMVIGAAFIGNLRVPRPLALALVLGAAVALAVQAADRIPHGIARPLLYGAPALALVAGASLGRGATFPAWLQPAVILGDASYSLYLLHLPVLWAGRIAATRLGIDMTGPVTPYVHVALCLAASVLIALLTYRWAERPATDALRSGLSRLRARRVRSITVFASPNGKVA
jgi:exopolysaccharide production protein ExoZ